MISRRKKAVVSTHGITQEQPQATKRETSFEDLNKNLLLGVEN
jgi:hypothetical protein